MDLRGENFTVSIDAADLTDESLQAGITEMMEEAAEVRGLEVPAFAGAVAAEAIQDVKVDPSEIKESLFEQLDTAFSGYKTVVDHINSGRKESEKFEVADPETVEAEFKDWLTIKKIKYMARAQEADPELSWTVIATPNNVEVIPEEAEELAVEFGKGQPCPTHIWNPILKRYSASELSGTDPDNGNKIRFAAVPSKLTPELCGTVDAQRDALAKLQADMPDARVASHLDDLVYWYTLRAGGDDLAHDDAFERTCSRHFDLPKQRLGGDVHVLKSFVLDDGKPHVLDSGARFENRGRALVG